MFQKKKEESNRKSLILYTNNYQLHTTRRFNKDHMVSKDRHNVKVNVFRKFAPVQKIRYVKYNYVEFYYKVFGLNLSGQAQESSISLPP